MRRSPRGSASRPSWWASRARRARRAGRTTCATAREAIAAAGAALEAALDAGAFPVLLASDCTIAIATLPALARHEPATRVLWLDAHGDFNTPATTASGYPRRHVPRGGVRPLGRRLRRGLDPQRVVLSDGRDLDARRARGDGARWAARRPAGRVAAAVRGERLFVHLDLDVLDPSEMAFSFPAAHGMAIARAARPLARSPAVAEIAASRSRRPRPPGAGASRRQRSATSSGRRGRPRRRRADRRDVHAQAYCAAAESASRPCRARGWTSAPARASRRRIVPPPARPCARRRRYRRSRRRRSPRRPTQVAGASARASEHGDARRTRASATRSRFTPRPRPALASGGGDGRARDHADRQPLPGEAAGDGGPRAGSDADRSWHDHATSATDGTHAKHSKQPVRSRDRRSRNSHLT